MGGLRGILLTLFRQQGRRVFARARQAIFRGGMEDEGFPEDYLEQFGVPADYLVLWKSGEDGIRALNGSGRQRASICDQLQETGVVN